MLLLLLYEVRVIKHGQDERTAKYQILSVFGKWQCNAARGIALPPLVV